jgi:SHS2 domain-containing protein
VVDAVAGFEYRDHVSDVTIRAWGPSIEETLTQACLGMWALVADSCSVPLTREWTVSVCGASLGELLVNLLNEQIFAFDSAGLVAGGVEGVSVEEKGGMLEARVAMKGCRSDELPQPPLRALKAATFHDLQVSPYLVEVTLDV